MPLKKEFGQLFGKTTLIVKTDVPKEQEETFKVRIPKALKRIKTLAENEIEKYNSSQSTEDEKICNLLMKEINHILLGANSKIWHGSPVWFIDDNPIVGYSRLKNDIQLLFWSGQTFEDKELKVVGKYKAAEVRYT